MCKFELSGASPVNRCQLADYFEWATGMTQPKDPVLHFPPLPLDKEGYCIFHSRDIDWKIKNKFAKWMDNLVAYLKCYDKVLYMMTHPQTLKVVDLTGVCLIGKEVRLKSGGTETRIKFKELQLNDHIEIKLDHAEILDKCVFENCKLANTEISFNHTLVNGELYFSNTAFGQVQFNNARLNGGMLITNCTFDKYAEFGGMMVGTMLQISRSQFLTHAYFTNSNLRCESVFFEDNIFQGKTDFGMCTFHGDAELPMPDSTARSLLPPIITKPMYSSRPVKAITNYSMKMSILPLLTSSMKFSSD